MLPTKVIFQIDFSTNMKLYQWLKELLQLPIYEDEELEHTFFRESLYKKFPGIILTFDLIGELQLYIWLKDLMQNPIYDDESKEENGFRKELFDTLNTINPVRQKVSSIREAMTKQKSTHPIFGDDDIPF